VLRQQRSDQVSRRLLLGAAWVDHDLVFDRGDGEPMPPDGVSRAFYRLTHDKLGMPDVRLHDLRHQYATSLLVAGVHPKIASEALGHSSVAFTLDTYSHVVPAMQEQAGAAIEAVLGHAVRD
jgi:integrase